MAFMDTVFHIQIKQTLCISRLLIKHVMEQAVGPAHSCVYQQASCAPPEMKKLPSPRAVVF